MNDLLISIRMYAFWTVLLGLVYPVMMTFASQGLFPKQASGGFESRGGQTIGAELIAQNFESEKYFRPRPSAVGFNPLPSGGSNAGPTSESLKTSVAELTKKLKAAHPDQKNDPPQDLLFASASGLDPHISPAAAEYQVNRVASARQMDVNVVRAIVKTSTEDRQFGFLGEPRVNVLAMNLNLDRAQRIESAPVLAPTPVPSPTPPPEATPSK